MRLRRRKRNGLMSGVIHFLFKNPTSAPDGVEAQRGHPANFVVANDHEKSVYIINLQTEESGFERGRASTG